MAPEVIRKLMAAFPDKEIFIMYGQTEASPRVTWLPPDRLKEKVGSIGIPVPGVDVRVAGESAMEMPVGDIGEIVVSGDCVMLGYWNQPDEQTQVLRNGRLFTGDLARRDEDGYIYVVSRKKEIIKAGGNRVSAKEIEERILENDKVLEVAVFGVEDEVLGEAIKAVMVLKESQSASIKEIQEHVALKLARHKIPKYIDFVESLPKYQSGKVNKLALTNPELLDSLRKSGMLNNNKPADNQGH
jgi:acyl-CoA synthetase (AMP-forming)/AMP-acid ligase II